MDAPSRGRELILHVMLTESIEISGYAVRSWNWASASAGAARPSRRGDGRRQGTGFEHCCRGVAGCQQNFADGAGFLVLAVVAFVIGRGADAGAQREGAVGFPDDVGEA